jgi:hypothetical protein
MHSRNKTKHDVSSIKQTTEHVKTYNKIITSPNIIVNSIEHLVVDKVKTENDQFRKRKDNEIFIRETLNAIGNTGTALKFAPANIINAGMALSEILELNNHTAKLQNNFVYSDVFNSVRDNEMKNGKSQIDAEKIANNFARDVIFDRS